jgi:hypothetical protein
MKKVYVHVSAIFLLMITCVLSVKCQNIEETTNFRVFGIGLHMEQIKTSDLNQSLLQPANKIILILNAGKNFRFEPEIGYYSITDKTNDLNGNCFSFGIGGLGMYQYKKVNIYGGLRLEFTTAESDYIFQYKHETEKNDITSVGLVFGSEYMFSPHFSLGCEIGLKYSSLNTNNDPTYNDYQMDYYLTQTGIFLRFFL